MISMREAYEKIGANYDDACARLMGEEMLARFALKFLDDESMDKLEAAMAAGDAEGAFMAAHTLKGVSQNLGFDNLYEPAVVVTEALRCAAPMPLTALARGCMRCSSNMRLRCRPCARRPNKSLRALGCAPVAYRQKGAPSDHVAGGAPLSVMRFAN